MLIFGHIHPKSPLGPIVSGPRGHKQIFPQSLLCPSVESIRWVYDVYLATAALTSMAALSLSEHGPIYLYPSLTHPCFGLGGHIWYDSIDRMDGGWREGGS